MKHIITTLALVAATTASAEFLTGNDLLERMNSDKGYDKGVANGYVMGAFDAGHGGNHCPPEGVNLRQVSDMVKQELIATPAARHLSADSFLAYALNKAWPCAKRSGTKI